MSQETCELFERLQSSQLFLVLGINVIEDEESCLAIARKIQEIAAQFAYPVIFKASFDKANRTECTGYRGIGLEKGIQILHKVKSLVGLPILTDIHESWQATKVAEVADVIQIPAFLCRQTDLIIAAARTGRIINVKKGQWCNTDVALAAARKVKSCGNKNIILCERGTSFGYNDLIVDMTNFEKLKQESNLTLFDATHSCQKPGINSQVWTFNNYQLDNFAWIRTEQRKYLIFFL